MASLSTIHLLTQQVQGKPAATKLLLIQHVYGKPGCNTLADSAGVRAAWSAGVRPAWSIVYAEVSYDKAIELSPLDWRGLSDTYGSLFSLAKVLA
jgi:hypothetical protein